MPATANNPAEAINGSLIEYMYNVPQTIGPIILARLCEELLSPRYLPTRSPEIRPISAPTEGSIDPFPIAKSAINGQIQIAAVRLLI